MLEQILFTIHNTTTLLFGIYISAFFLGIRANRKNNLTLLLFALCDGGLYLFLLATHGEVFCSHVYPLVVHLPLTLFLVFYYQYPLISSIVSVCSAYLCCQLSNWIGLFVLGLTSTNECYYIARILTTCITFYLLCKYVCHTTQAIFVKDRRDMCIIGFLPFVYYVFDYAVTKFSSLLYSGNRTIVEFMSFAFCIAYLVFLIFYFREYEYKQDAKQYGELMEMKLLSLQDEIRQVKRSEQTLSILRHDTRHHFNILLTQLEQGQIEDAKAYIQQISNAYADTEITTYCTNEMVNSVLSIYHNRFSDLDFQLTYHVNIDHTLPCSDISFCAILSNALENAMHALQNMDISSKWTKLTLTKKDSHLLLQIENPVQELPHFVDGIPISTDKGHGIGVRSIVYYVEQLGGQCHFSISDYRFVVRIII